MKRKSLWLVVIAFLCACTAKPPTRVEEPIKQTKPKASLPNASKVPSRAASAKEVDAALQRIFGRVVVADRGHHSFVTGDFNGDGSPDLAVIVFPLKAKLGMINDELANWTVQDASQFFSPPQGQGVVFRQKEARPAVRAGEPLLAVIHGVGADGWRDPTARQAYLVRHAGFGPFRTVPAQRRIENTPASIKNADVIYEGSGKAGFLFWNGSQYAWNPKTNGKPESERRN
ncbi:MAG TPA: FG-GAP repeat protein [Terriglobales bacterium]|nr:FG-GAP repeat protein [Terriglobales bacterium]